MSSTTSDLSISTIQDTVLGSVKEPKPTNRVCRALITIFHETPEAAKIHPAAYFGDDWESKLQIWVAQWEKCPTTETVHAHIYLEFHRTCNVQWRRLHDIIKAVSPRNNIKVPKRSSNNQRQGAVNYCSKEGFLEETERWCWSRPPLDVKFDAEHWGNRDKKKSRVDKQREWILSKPWHYTWSKIVHESPTSQELLCNCSWGEKFHRGRMESLPARTIESVIVYYGAGGTGKTTTAKYYGATDGEPDQVRYYRRNYNDGIFWGGGSTAYKNQRIIHLDEFVGQETLGEFKEICDVGHEGKHVNVKNGGVKLNHETVIVTSNVHPALWYRKALKKDPNHWTPFWRRITAVVFFPPNRPDGSVNRAGERKDGDIIPIHCVDQTDEWLDLSSWDDAVEHANKYWPMELEEEEHDCDRVWTYNAHEGQWLVNGNLPTADDYRAKKRRVG